MTIPTLSVPLGQGTAGGALAWLVPLPPEEASDIAEDFCQSVAAERAARLSQ